MNLTHSSSPHELAVLRALLRLARRRTPPAREELLVRVGGNASELRAALGHLERAGFIERLAPSAGPMARLTMPGFAVAVAAAAAQRDARVRGVKTVKKSRARRRAA